MFPIQLQQKIPHYIKLIRLDKPIGIFLLLWPTLWGLWLAHSGIPPLSILLIFVFGVILMRSAGCAMNDFADRHFDAFVERTRYRPIPNGLVRPLEALIIAGSLAGCAFLLVLFCNKTTILMSVVGVLLASIYPFLKRITYLPQFGLSLAYTWGIPMAFTAAGKPVDFAVWVLYLTVCLWPIIYDTIYAMIDREDDIVIGVKSTAVLFNDMDKLIIALLQCLFLVMLVIVGLMYRLNNYYYISLFIVGFLFVYQQWLIKDKDKNSCYRAFLSNHWVGLVIFSGIFLSVYA